MISILIIVLSGNFFVLQRKGKIEHIGQKDSYQTAVEMLQFDNT